MNRKCFVTGLRIELILFILIGTNCAQPSANTVSTNRTNGLLTASFNIVSEDDLAYDASRRDIAPYDPRTALSGLYWQCFPVHETKVKYRTWMADNERGRSSVRCAPEVSIRHNSKLQLYVDRRGHEVRACKDFIVEWKRLTQGQEVVCLNGEGGFYSRDRELGSYTLWTWVKVKTKRGCLSYFVGECETTGCARGGCRALTIGNGNSSAISK